MGFTLLMGYVNRGHQMFISVQATMDEPCNSLMEVFCLSIFHLVKERNLLQFGFGQAKPIADVLSNDAELVRIPQEPPVFFGFAGGW